MWRWALQWRWGPSPLSRGVSRPLPGGVVSRPGFSRALPPWVSPSPLVSPHGSSVHSCSSHPPFAPVLAALVSSLAWERGPGKQGGHRRGPRSAVCVVSSLCPACHPRGPSASQPPSLPLISVSGSNGHRMLGPGPGPHLDLRPAKLHALLNCVRVTYAPLARCLHPHFHRAGPRCRLFLSGLLQQPPK